MRALVLPLLLLVALGTDLVGAGAAPRVQQGLATFFGAGLQGRKTAGGARLDAKALTAAHPTHPAGTLLKVTNLANSRSVVVRVVDRGPAKRIRKKGVVVDVSRAAARRLGFTRDGKARVRVEVVNES